MTRLPFLDRSRLRRTGVSAGGGKRNSLVGEALRTRFHTEPHRYLADDFFEWALSPRGRESLGLAVLAASSIALIYVLHHA
jgi:hypothetical protein